MLENNWQRDWASRLIELPPAKKIAIAITADIVVLILAALTVVALVALPHRGWYSIDLGFFFVGPAVTIPALWVVGVYRAVVRFSGLALLSRLAQGFGIALLLLLALYALLGRFDDYWNLLTLYAVAGWGGIVLLRLSAARLLHANGDAAACDRVLIYGAGDAGMQLAAALSGNCGYHPVGFMDDRQDLHGRILMGLPVYAPERLPELKTSEAFDRVLLAIPSASRSRRRQILESLERLAIPVMVMPGLNELVSGEKRVDELRQVQIEDLLGRDSVAPMEPLMELHLRGRNVLITGAGGSIGSELCRQALKWGARRLVLFEICELALYQIEMELRATAQAASCELVPLLGNVTDRRSIQQALADYQIETVYHAAAYKHVPLVEQNVVTAVHNNIFGTLHTVLAARDTGVGNFVLISSDKAVRPTSVMGASKRVCELIVQAQAAGRPQMRMSIVRFGNVLASSGSVVPLFKEQIRRGGPVTVTHPNVTRYFMTIQEAAQLVVQAGAMGHTGEVFVLDMSEPVRIADLAERMIRLSGLEVRSQTNPYGDVAIEFTGLRPGEKLYEELLIAHNPNVTEHPRIFLAKEKFLPWPALQSSLSSIERAAEAGSAAGVLMELRHLIDGFRGGAGAEQIEHAQVTHRVAPIKSGATPAAAPAKSAGNDDLSLSVAS